MPQAGFEPAFPANEEPLTHALDRAANGIGKLFMCQLLNNKARGGAVGSGLYYKPEGRGFDFRWCHCDFLFT